MKKKFIYIVLVTVVLFNLSSCKKYLDELPDNRAELNNTDKISRLLVSAYPANAYVVAAEFSSDNVDDYGPSYSTTKLWQQMYGWEDITETANDGIERIWSGCYGAIASANQALTAIDELGNPSSLNAAKGEALVARAYNHFILVNVFGQHYSPTTSATDLGVTYMLKSENTLDPKYTRNSVKEVYDYILKDIEEGLPLINDASYANANVAKFHFNKSAANAFAARVYLYMGRWADAVKHATASFENSPTSYVRDYVKIASFSASFSNMAREYNGSSIKANLLITPAVSSMGTIFGGYTSNTRIVPGAAVANFETLLSKGPFGTFSTTGYRLKAFSYTSSSNKVLFPHLSYQFETTDPVANTGFSHGVFSPFTFEEVLLTRAEANIQLKNYTAALADMQYWGNFTYTSTTLPTLTEANINTWANSFAYYTPTAPTPKKKLNPEFTIEAGTQENMLHAVLYMRRIETYHTGLRWFDIKRYGIEVTRRSTTGAVINSVSSNTLAIKDPRRAIQLPQDVIAAGLTPNPR
ncbi:RagB/SusD family nutrient uptake outer membrane protein [Pedobacter nototheniae]|uniref:RagB/SusD family nutrient uptake outer membrane protein n=1 Tax=Pedobacter nototheniae TaxID=2488994 RepID=UPI002930C056|nr:RagB/SusD family nutrient uptake outer membrane protein [Pedobacter nototheniae]